MTESVEQTRDVENWDAYWRENQGKDRSWFSRLVSWARKYYFAKAFAAFIARHHDIKGKKICEIGVGTGQTLAWLKKMGAGECVGVDNSKEAIALARKQDYDCQFVFGNAFSLDFPDKHFDIVYSLGLIEHFTKAEQRQLIAEQKRIAKECVFIEVPHDIFYFRWLFAINKKLGRKLTFSDEEQFTKKTFQELGLQGKTLQMPSAFFLTIGHFEYI